MEDLNIMNEEVNNEPVEFGSETETDIATLKEYSSMAQKLLKTLEDGVNKLKLSAISTLATDGLSYTILDRLLPFKKEVIATWTRETTVDFLNKFRLDETEAPAFETKTDEELTELINKIKDYSLEVIKAEYDYEKTRSNSEEMIKPYLDELRKHDTTAERLSKLDELRKFAEEETDEKQKKHYLKVIATLEQVVDYSFMFERLDKFGDEEISKIVEAFINTKHGGAYVVQRYESKIKKLKFKEDIFKHFFNIEENFLPEEYHIYNNLFLFVYMRFVAYIDVYNPTEATFAQKITSAIANLVYHSFSDAEDEKAFVEVVKKIDDYFKDYASIFENYNTTYKNNATRKEFEAKQKEGFHAQILEDLKNMGITDPDLTKTDEELIQLLAETRQELILSQIETETDIEMGTEDDEVPVEVTPEEEKPTEIYGHEDHLA